MISAWLTAKAFFGLSRGSWLLIAAVALFVLWLVLGAVENADDANNQKIGQTVEREKNLQETVKEVEKANDAREEIRRPGPSGDRVRYDQCLRTARTPANCERYLPVDEAPKR